jgi:hypothetical protein
MICGVRHALLLVVLIAGCGRKKDVPTCEVMADHVLTMFTPADQFARDVRDVFANRCKTDAWSAEMRTCVGKTHSVVEPQSCKLKLTPAQATALEADLHTAEERDRDRVMPVACTRYERILGEVLACDVLPKAVRDQLAARFAEEKARWATITNKRSLDPMCSTGVASLKQAAQDCPGSAK